MAKKAEPVPAKRPDRARGTPRRHAADGTRRRDHGGHADHRTRRRESPVPKGALAGTRKADPGRGTASSDSGARTGPSIAVTAHVHEKETEAWSAEIRFESLDGTRGRLRCPLSKLRKPELLDELIDRGFPAPTDRDKLR